MSPSEKGLVAEYKFALAALARGCNVAWPGSYSNYDLITESSSGAITRVQVKVCHRNKSAIAGSKNRRYSKKDCDVIAILKKNTWFIIPVESCPSTFYYSSKKLQQYRSAWRYIEYPAQKGAQDERLSERD